MSLDHNLAAAGAGSVDPIIVDGFDERWAEWQEKGRRQNAQMLRVVRVLAWCAGAGAAAFLTWVLM